jgi:hypothetical protein
MDNEGSIGNAGTEGTPVKDLEQKAVGIYKKIVDAAITDSHDRHIWIQTQGSGNVDYSEKNWRISVGRSENLSENRRKDYYHNVFTPEEFDRGIIGVTQRYIQNPKDGPRSGQMTTIWIAQTDDGYRAVNVQRMGVGQEPVFTDVLLNERVTEAVDRVTRLLDVPEEILDGFGSFEEFRRKALNGLKEEKPISGVITPGPNDLNVFGGPNGFRLPEHVEMAAIERRNASK